MGYFSQRVIFGCIQSHRFRARGTFDHDLRIVESRNQIEVTAVLPILLKVQEPLNHGYKF